MFVILKKGVVMSQEEMQRLWAEFNYRLREMLNNDRTLSPSSPAVKSLIKEYQDKGVPIRVITDEDIQKAMRSTMQTLKDMLSQMGIDADEDNIFTSNDTESLHQNIKPCKYHKKELDTVLNRDTEISKKEVENLTIDMETMTDNEIWNKYFGGIPK